MTLKEADPMTGHNTSDTRAPRRIDGMVRDDGLRAAIGYWDGLRGNRLLPSRMDLDPAALRPHLRDAAILEVAAPGSLRIRLGGARINALLGMDARGLPLRALFDLSERARISDEVEAAIAAPDLLLLDVVAPAPRFGVPEAQSLRAQIAILPMTDADLGPTRALYVMSTPMRDIRSADAPIRWCTTGHHRLPIRVGEPVLDMRHIPACPGPCSATGAHRSRDGNARPDGARAVPRDRWWPCLTRI
jgi:hypothetical protein